ncbi:hypothetical protein [Nitrosarchaeum sp.]|uniref:hypothetical protein n=1 Tax=Nitrosarchaeum sp. TaxID=2026886 RepID=UPI00260C3B84|nr:hypothetical protein [Nitrosarchaeum sp.]
MTKVRSVIIMFMLVTISIPLFSDAYAHSMFNSAEEFLGGYRVQVATLPEFPQIGEKSQILFRVGDSEFNEVDQFTMGVRFFYNDQQIDAINPELHKGGHYETDYVWKNSGNHIVKVDLYDMEGSPEVLTYTFNMGTQNPFGYIFIMAITFGAITLGIVIAYIYIPKKIKLKSKL